jgi:hypothetical protein
LDPLAPTAAHGLGSYTDVGTPQGRAILNPVGDLNPTGAALYKEGTRASIRLRILLLPSAVSSLLGSRIRGSDV